jgi:hypothetical protein
MEIILDRSAQAPHLLVAALWRRMKAIGQKASSDGFRPMPPGAE